MSACLTVRRSMAVTADVSEITVKWRTVVPKQVLLQRESPICKHQEVRRMTIGIQTLEIQIRQHGNRSIGLSTLVNRGGSSCIQVVPRRVIAVVNISCDLY
jgi:hypothetical protein